MQRIDANTSRDFSRFDMLSTDELRQIIRQDSLLNENESANVEAILYISKLLHQNGPLRRTTAATIK